MSLGIAQPPHDGPVRLVDPGDALRVACCEASAHGDGDPDPPSRAVLGASASWLPGTCRTLPQDDGLVLAGQLGGAAGNAARVGEYARAGQTVG